MQMNNKEGIKRFRDKGNEALLKKIIQLHEWQAFLPKKAEDMSCNERKRVLRYLMFLKEKHYSSIKPGDVQVEVQMEDLCKNT